MNMFRGLPLSLIVAFVACEGEPPRALFSEVAESSGLVFRHVNGASGEFHLPEIMGAGVALFDYDNDGDLDVYLVQGGRLGGGDDAATNRLFRNDTEATGSQNPPLRFVDVTAASGLGDHGYGMGVATGDYDNDGLVDVYLTNFGPNKLYHNEGGGVFTDVTAESGSGDTRWSVPASFVDIDADGWLDLFVGNYVEYTLANPRECFNLVRDYCSPKVYPPAPDRLLRNMGNGRFADVTVASRLATAFGNALGSSAFDFDGDGALDLYVANDGGPNQLWANLGSGRFEDRALVSGCALNEQGRPEAGMGVAVADLDRDGDEDIVLTHLRGETHTLYRNDGHGLFFDHTIAAGLAAASRPATGFGAGWVDLELDGDLDLFVANGAVTASEQLVQAGDSFPYHERNQLFRRDGASFVEVTVGLGAVFTLSEVSRGAAFGDLDNDGDTDIVVTQNNGPVRLLRNNGPGRASWIGFRVLDRENGRDALGAWVRLVGVDGGFFGARVRTDGSYASASDPRVLFGLAGKRGPVTVEVVWPGGASERFPGLRTHRYHTLIRGRGRD